MQLFIIKKKMIAFVRDAYFIMRNLNRICLHLWKKQSKQNKKRREMYKNKSMGENKQNSISGELHSHNDRQYKISRICVECI